MTRMNDDYSDKDDDLKKSLTIRCQSSNLVGAVDGGCTHGMTPARMRDEGCVRRMGERFRKLERA